MAIDKLHVGWDRKNKKEKIEIPVNALKRHFAALGASGSGKTVMVKALMEECIRAEIPLMMVDLQGDLASMALMGDKKTVEKKGTPGQYHEEIENKAQVAIYTPASSKGIPISMNPLKAPPEGLDREDFIQAVDSVADTVASILQYNTDKGKGSEIKDYLYLLFEAIWKQGKEVETFEKLADYIVEDSFLPAHAQSMLKDRYKEDLVKGVRGMTIGAESLLFNLGMPMDVEAMMNWTDPGKVPVNVLYLNTLRSQEDKVNFIADIARQVYGWMLRNPSDKVQLVFVLDELAGLVPPIRNPPSKKSIQLLLKQARKYGVSLLLATQNISDVDYKSLGQVSTWALGKLIARQDIDKVKDIISAISPAETDEILSILPKQNVGQFMLLNPDVYDSVKRVSVRWLVTEHTTLDDSRVRQILDRTGIRSKFPDVEGRKSTEEPSSGSGSPMRSDQAQESGIIAKEEASPEEKEVAVPGVRSARDVLPAMDTSPLALSAEELSERTGEPLDVVVKELEELEDDDKLESQEFNGVKIYWSKKHRMDPKNNIVGPLYRFHLEIPRGVAEKKMKSHIPKTLGIKATEEILDDFTQIHYIPLWRLGVIKSEKTGGFMGIGSKKEQINKFYYINGLTGAVLVYNNDENSFDFKLSGIDEPDTVQTLPSDVILDPEVLDGLRGDDLKPKLNREDAVDHLKQLLGVRINRRVVPSLAWVPIWEFKLRDKDYNEERWAYIEGIYGGLLSENPLEK